MIGDTRIERRNARMSPITKYFNGMSYRSVFLYSIFIILFVAFSFTRSLEYEAKVTLIIFIIAMVLWVATKLPAGYVALGSLLSIILLKGASTSLLYESFSLEIVWLMIGAFMIGEAVKRSGLADRMMNSILHRSTSYNGLLFYVMVALFPLAIFIPSTSGRAALTLPVVKELGRRIKDEKQKQTLALFVPIIILMSTSATVIGAGSHLIGIELLNQTTGDSISYFNWLIWGLPFALFISLVTYFVIKLYMVRQGSNPVSTEIVSDSVEHEKKAMTKKESQTLIIIGILVLLWLTEAVHGYEIGFITILGAIVLMTPKYGLISWRQGIKAVSWNLIIFVSAATALGINLVETGVVGWVEEHIFQFISTYSGFSHWGILCVILLISITSHLYVTSHTTRAIVFLPGFLMLSTSLDLNATAVLFLSLIGMNYCVTFPVSSKALLVYFEQEEMNFEARDLIKLSMLLMPVYFISMLIFYYTYWSWTGLSL
ncbi:SLC13 family permease [Oceanobacillus iheyensis]|nr:SLC13 family permease [Oceanobacillus iheyensis]